MKKSAYSSHTWQTPIYLESFKFMISKGISSSCIWNNAIAEILKCNRCKSLAYKITNRSSGKTHICSIGMTEIMQCHDEQFKGLLC